MHLDGTYAKIAHGHCTLLNQLQADKTLSDLMQLLPLLMIADIRSVGVILNVSVHTRFGDSMESFKTVYMKIIRVNPGQFLNNPHSLIEKWSKVHIKLLRMLMIKDKLFVGPPSNEELARKPEGVAITTHVSEVSKATSSFDIDLESNPADTSGAEMLGIVTGTFKKEDPLLHHRLAMVSKYCHPVISKVCWTPEFVMGVIERSCDLLRAQQTVKTCDITNDWSRASLLRSQ